MKRSSSRWTYLVTSARFWSMSKVWSRTCLRLGRNSQQKRRRLMILKLTCKIQITWLRHWLFWRTQSPYRGECTSWRCIVCWPSSNCRAMPTGRMCVWGHRYFSFSLQLSMIQNWTSKRTQQKFKSKRRLRKWKLVKMSHQLLMISDSILQQHIYFN